MTVRHAIMEIDNTMAGLWENGKKFVIRRGGRRDWHLTIFNDNSMMLITHKPYTEVDYFENRPAKLTYDDTTQSILIARPVISYRLKIDDAAVYQSFKDLGLEAVYAE
jgi:hypothetical protein